MRALAVSIWVFINLLFFGMCGYMYLLWSQYWIYTQTEDSTTAYNYDQQIYYYNRGYPPSYFNDTPKFNTSDRRKRAQHTTKENPITIIKNSKPRFPNLQESEFQMDTKKFRCLQNESTSECHKKTFEYKTQLLKELRRVSLMDESNMLKHKNPYNVHYNGTKGVDTNVKDMLCALQSINLKTITRNEYPFSNETFKEFFPKKGPFENKTFKSCAIVASAGSLRDSSLGQRIDSHEVVLRFNHAPTEKYEVDVGGKTNFRILNSQVVSKPKFNFLQSKMYRNITILVWDPNRFMESLDDWFKKPDFNLFPNYFEHRRSYRKTKTYVLNPNSLWDLWVFLQKYSINQLPKNPPSSGFLGLAVLLHHCDYVDMFEYIPSVRVTKICHYFDEEDNPACTFGAWHPLASEKLFAYSLNIASDNAVFQTGYIRIPGFSKYC